MEAVCKKLELSVTLHHIPSLREAIKPAATYGEVQEPINRVRLSMHHELKDRKFMFVPPIEAGFYGLKEAFGPAVARRFGECITDIEEAGNCIAIGRSTAGVFHLMRVMERGVQRLGKKLGVTLTEEKNWQNILDEINKAIRELPDKSSALKAKKSRLAAASDHLFNIKLAWRNPVMHPKSVYSPEEAADVYRNVKSFMGLLADIV